MVDNQIPNRMIRVLNALSRHNGPTSFAELKEATGLTPATLSRVLNNLCTHNYAIKTGHGHYIAGPELLEMGLEITRNQITPGFKATLSSLRQQTHLNAELYLITPGGPVYLTHAAARGEANVPFRYGHVVANRTVHPAALFFLAMHKSQKCDGSKCNFIVDRGGQWPELFRAAAMIKGSNFCLAVSGMLTNIDETRHAEIRDALHRAGDEAEIPWRERDE
jgi:hypothetical protein